MESPTTEPSETARDRIPAPQLLADQEPSGPIRFLTLGPTLLSAAIPAALFLAVLHNPEYPIAQDTPSYAVPGSNFWHGLGYGAHDSTGRFVPEMNRTPLYPLLIGPFYREGSSWYWPVLFAQALLRAAIAWLLLHLPGRRRAPLLSRAGCLAAWLVALDATAALLAVRIITETLSAFLLLLVLWCVLAWRDTNRWPWIAAAGTLAGLNVLCRPINAIVAGILLIDLWGLCAKRSRRGTPRWWIAPVVFAATVAVFPTLWMVRNATYAGRPLLSLVISLDLYYYRAAYVQSVLSGRDLETTQREMAEAERKQFDGRNAMPWETGSWRAERAREILRAQPAILARGTAVGLIRTVVGPGIETWKDLVRNADRTPRTSGEWPRSTATRPRWVFLPIAWSLAHLAVIYLAVTVGLFRAIRRRHLPFAMGIAMVLTAALILAAAGPEAYSRFRIPVMPLLALAAGISVFFPAPKESVPERHSSPPR